MLTNAIAALGLILLLFTSCSVRRSEPIKGPLTLDDPNVKKGQVVFMEKCNRCHPAGESGLGPAINTTPAPDFAKRFQIRHGLGAMPSFGEDDLSDEELDMIISYLNALSQNN